MAELLKRAAALAGVAIGVGLATNASATLTIDYPMEYSSPGIVGTVEGFAGDNPGSDAAVFAQKLLNVTGLSTTWNDSGDSYRQYVTSSVYDYSGTILGAGIKTDVLDNKDGGAIYIAGGWDFAIAKYDGKNAGWVMFALGGQDAWIPRFSHSFWGVDGDQYQVSNFTVFNPIPEPTTMIAGALLLLPFGASTVRYARKDRKG